MATAIIMPKAGMTVESCIIGKWHKNVGDQVTKDELLFDYETDKATFECEAGVSGTLLAVFYHNGDEVACLKTVAVVGNVGEDISEFIPQDPVDTQNKAEEAPQTHINTVLNLTSVQEGEALLISPRAKQLATTMKIPLSSLSPSGPQGRIIERDIIAYSLKEKGGSGIGGRHLKAEDSSGINNAEYEEEQPSQLRKLIAQTMFSSLSEMAQLTHHHSCDASQILDLRKSFKASAKPELQQISLNDMVMFAVAATLMNYPYLNATFIQGVIRKYHHVNLAMAVDSQRGLLVPVITAADKLCLADLAIKTKELASLARLGSINPDLLQGGSFTVSNLGAYGVEMFTPIINPPQVAILGVCTISPRVKNSLAGLEVYPALGLSLTYDHRVVDGALASRFLQELSQYISNFKDNFHNEGENYGE